MSEQGPCPRCPQLEAELWRAQRELQQARRELEQAKAKIRQLRDVIYSIARECQDVQGKARPILSRSSGVPRGTWSRVKGRVDVADLVLRLIGLAGPC